MEFMEPFFDALQVVFEPVGHKHGFAVGGFDQVLQSIELSFVNGEHSLVIAIYGAVGHLAQLV